MPALCRWCVPYSMSGPHASGNQLRYTGPKPSLRHAGRARLPNMRDQTMGSYILPACCAYGLPSLPAAKHHPAGPGAAPPAPPAGPAPDALLCVSVPTRACAAAASWRPVAACSGAHGLHPGVRKSAQIYNLQSVVYRSTCIWRADGGVQRTCCCCYCCAEQDPPPTAHTPQPAGTGNRCCTTIIPCHAHGHTPHCTALYRLVYRPPPRLCAGRLATTQARRPAAPAATGATWRGWAAVQTR